ncbi:MAG: hypothetical protein A3H51_01110 [Candidatus Spechtbacteria bacterium RIFCSPLOWO2_02_FULL_38_8]|uniref:N-acetyltransferase domain-containing protein n=1 Tax=Candidatus Spechtbacteria bacterium RIFCSPLOWO2_02_FULL_38_8 TaxID=1802164 RepID=A0A1G2HKL8_9BACT|nr:MAG: hypothetical protein A3H51_01110 [Candidatus Spechtbacteria bacterium RIFCSPLOWO2_02_FULL_38_8]
MKILLLGFNKNKRSYAVKRLVSELKKRGHTVTYMSWRGLVFSFMKSGVKIQRVNGTDLKYYDYIIPKAPISTTKTKGGAFLSHLYRHYLLVVKYFNQHHKHVFNEKTTEKIPFYDKLLQHFILNNEGIPVVPSMLYTGMQLPSSVYKKFKKPYIVKSVEGRSGKQVFLIKRITKIKSLLNEFGIGKLLVQKYISTKYDYRIIVLGNKVMGVMKRTAPEGDYRANVSLGGKAEKAVISEEVKQLAIRAAKAFSAEFAGVDVIQHKGRYYILEVNIFPGFEGFESVTGVDVAKELISYIEKKYLWTLETDFTHKEKKGIFNDIFEIEKNNLEKPLSKKEFMKTILERDLIVIFKEQKPIAYLTHYEKASVRRVTRWGILPKYRGQRMGRRMIRALIRISKEAGDKKINALIPQNNKKRQNTFKHAGFKKTKEKRENYFEDNIDGIVFEYNLKQKRKTKGSGLTKKLDPKNKKKEK